MSSTKYIKRINDFISLVDLRFFTEDPLFRLWNQEVDYEHLALCESEDCIVVHHDMLDSLYKILSKKYEMLHEGMYAIIEMQPLNATYWPDRRYQDDMLAMLRETKHDIPDWCDPYKNIPIFNAFPDQRYCACTSHIIRHYIQNISIRYSDEHRVRCYKTNWIGMPSIQRYYYGRLISHRYAYGPLAINKSPADDIPSSVEWNMRNCISDYTTIYGNVLLVPGHLWPPVLSKETYTDQQGRYHRRNGPAFKQSMYPFGELFLKHGENISKAVEQAGGIENIDDFTWEML